MTNLTFHFDILTEEQQISTVAATSTLTSSDLHFHLYLHIYMKYLWYYEEEV